MSEKSKTEDNPRNEKEFITLALERFKLAAEAESEWRKGGLEDLKFSVGEQWDDSIRSRREQKGRPCLVMNRTQQQVRQVVNEQRQQRPAIQINPVGGGADKGTAEIEQGLIRHIEVNSDAEIAQDHAFEMMVRARRGYWRIRTIRIDDGTREQEIKIDWIKNPFAVYYDPATAEPDCSDADWCFIVRDLKHGEYKAKYPKSSMARETDFSSIGDNEADWMDEDFIRVAEYYYRDGEDENGRPIIKWALINCREILKETLWPGRYIPVIRVAGDDFDIDGKQYCGGLVTQMKDPQRNYNYMYSKAAEAIALAPQAPWLAVAGQIEQYRQIWENANSDPPAVLPYDMKDLSGTVAPAPSRQVVEPPIQAMTLMCQMADQNLMAASGVNVERLGGDTKQEKSGRAILARQQQSQVATLNFSDNLARAMRFNARQLIDLIPHIYDVTRIQRIINPDGSPENVVIYKGDSAAPEAKLLAQKQAISKVFDVSVGRYDVTVSVGPSYQTRRQEAFAMGTELVKVLPPQVGQNISDLIVRNSDLPGADQIADRLKKMLPPNLVDDASQDPAVQLQKAQAQLQQYGTLIDHLTKALNEAEKAQSEKRVEAQNKLDIAELQERTKILVAEINTKAQESALRMKMEQEQWLALHGSASDFALQKDQQDSAAQEAEAGRAHESDMQASDQIAAQQQVELAAQQQPTQ